MMPMMKKRSYKKEAEKVYTTLQKQRKRIKRRSIFFAIFVFGVNAYAWFVFVSKADVNVQANVISWDVNFLDENSPVKDLEIITDDLYPGMNRFSKTININNGSDIGAKVEFRIDKVNVLGEQVSIKFDSFDEAVTYFRDTYPFYVTFDYDKTILDAGDHSSFTVNIDWPYEKSDTGAREYYQLTSQYKYDSSVTYYNLVNNDYVKANVTETSFINNRENLYLEKDDADSFWGYSCKNYKKTNNDVCFKFHIIITVTQYTK